MVKFVVDALLEKVFPAEPRRTTSLKAEVPVAAPEMVWVMEVPEKKAVGEKKV